MGDIADMMLDGTLCQCCGVYLEDSDEGYPQSCPACAEDEDDELATYMTEEIICPYCKYEYEESYTMYPGKLKCQECRKEFKMEKEVEVTYTTEKIAP